MKGDQESLTRHAAPEECDRCGGSLEASWTFCGRCGADRPAPSEAPSRDRGEGGSDGSRRRPFVRTAVLLTAFVLAASLGLAGMGWVKKAEVNELLDNARAELRSSQAELTFTEETLTAARARWKATNDRLAAARHHLREVETELEDAQGAVASAQDRLDLQANQIATLKSCLEGVSRALTFSAYMQYGRALQELNAVEVSCERVEDVL